MPDITARGISNVLRYEQVIHGGDVWQKCVALECLLGMLSYTQLTVSPSSDHPIAIVRRGGNDEKSPLSRNYCGADGNIGIVAIYNSRNGPPQRHLSGPKSTSLLRRALPSEVRRDLAL